MVTGAFAREPLRLELTDTAFRAFLAGQLGAGGRVTWRADTVLVRDTEGPRACGRALEGQYLAVRRLERGIEIVR
ncbi:MAG: hypothetical protein ACT4P7_17175 [Gemmatimonadaceae bacterium]